MAETKKQRELTHIGDILQTIKPHLRVRFDGTSFHVWKDGGWVECIPTDEDGQVLYMTFWYSDDLLPKEMEVSYVTLPS